jgi:hypothetical protein
MLITRLHLSVAILTTLPSVAAGTALEATLSAEIDKGGRAHAELTLINHSKQNVCFFDQLEALMLRNDGSILGNAEIIDYLQPDSMNVVWTGGYPQHFQISFNPPELTLNRDEVAQAAKVTTTFEAYDCTELLAAHREEPKYPLYKMNLSATPIKN